MTESVFIVSVGFTRNELDLFLTLSRSERLKDTIQEVERDVMESAAAEPPLDGVPDNAHQQIVAGVVLRWLALCALEGIRAPTSDNGEWVREAFGGGWDDLEAGDEPR